MNLWLIFLTGLTSGGVTCAAMQGGLLASIIANQKKDSKVVGFGQDDYLPVAAFLTTKLLSHIILGFFLGWLGSQVELSLSVRLFFQTLAALFMLATAMNLLNVHPLFRYLTIQPPKFAYRYIKASSASLFAPALFGVLTVLIPCGVTQAMEVLAITSGSPVQGALIMGSFVLGTAPMFIVIGLATARLSETWQKTFLRAAAFLLILMSLYSLNGALTAIDSPYSVERIVSVLSTPVSSSSVVATTNGVQQATISITSAGYSPRKFSVKVGVPVELKVMAGEVYSCATAFTFKAFGINAFVKPNTNQIFTFTPTQKGRYTFSCSMGMYSGTMEVI
ncbi:MAG: putative membrane protein [Microgenomates group bacterium GW2011_GWA2_46_7]|nr:MAG: putative membrane protein [Microgenomates group bacterium GW2011_GWA2_46_7]